MRQILKIACQTKAHFLHLREFSLTCRNVATQSQWSISNLYTSRNTYGALGHPHQTPLLWRNEHTYLISNHEAQRGITKSSKLRYSTTLSLEDVKVQQYLAKLREHNAAALRGEGDASVQAAPHSQAALMVLLDQVRPAELQHED